MLDFLLDPIRRRTVPFLNGLGYGLHLAALIVFVALTEDRPDQGFFGSGPSLFCTCCGERWHIFTSRSCPNGCPWVYAVFRGPAWAGDDGTLHRVQERHCEAARRTSRHEQMN